MSFNTLDVPPINPGFVHEMTEKGYSVARQTVPQEICSNLAKSAVARKNRAINLSSTYQPAKSLDETAVVALAVHEAFFQAGHTQWEPNLSVFMQNGELMNPHADEEIYKIGVAIAYFSGSLNMQVADTFDGLRHPAVIENILPGDVVFLRALRIGDESSKWVADGRTWHNAVGIERTMLHFGYIL